MSAAAEYHAGSPAGAEICREAARALAPCSRCDGGLAISGSATAALAELFRLLAREREVPDVAIRAARRLIAEANGATGTRPAAPAPRTPGDEDPRGGHPPDTVLASR